MSIKENLDDFAYSVKESYYQLEDKIGFPPIILLALAFVALIAALYLLQPGEDIKPPEDKITASFFFRDDMERPIMGLEVLFDVDGNSFKRVTDSRGKIPLRLPENSNIRVSVEEGDYKAYSHSFKAGGSSLKETIKLRLAKLPPKKKTIRFMDEKGIIKGKVITATIMCSNGTVFTARDTDADGVIEVLLPEGCEDIKVKANLPGYEEKETGYFGSDDSMTVTLKRKEIPKGRIKFRIVDEGGRTLTGINLTITLRSSNGDTIPLKSNGYAIVATPSPIPTGTYSASAVDDGDEYIVANLGELGSIEVEKDKTVEKEIVLSKKVKGWIKVTVTDQDTGERVAGAAVILSNTLGTVIESRGTGEQGNDVTFSLYDEGVFDVIAKKEGGIGEGYFPKTVRVQDLNSEITIALEKVTADNVGRTIVSVKDEDSNPVRDAKVMFRYKDTEAIAEITESGNYKLTDENGEAEFFLGQVDREVYAYAIKYPAVGGRKEDAKTIGALELNEFDVTLLIGDSTLTLKTIDSSGSLVTETFFEVFGQDGSSVSDGKIPMVDGQYIYELKADKIVYLVFSKEGYMDYQSEEIELWPDEGFTVTAIMRHLGEILQPTVEFKGAFQNDLPAEAIRAGEKYDFRFTLIFPNNDELNKAGFHFRAGEKMSMEDDFLYIKTINAPNHDSLVKGGTYTPPTNEASEEVAGVRAKWLTVEWLGPQSGIYNVSIEVKIRDNVYPNTMLPVYFRAYSVKGSEYVRTPLDQELGTAESVPEKDGLYAETFEHLFFEGSEPFCQEDFCVTGEWLYDKQEDIFLKKPYSMMVLGDYNFLFVLQNNSGETYDNMRLDVKNWLGGDDKQDIKVKSFIFHDADGLYLKQNVDDYEFSLTTLGEFVFPANLKLNLEMQPRNATDTELYLRLIGDQEVIFEERFEFHITVEDQMVIELDPEEIAPFEEKELTVKLTEAGSGNKIKDALVRLTRETSDGLYQVMTAVTDVQGEAKFKIAASPPLTKLTIEAEKTGYMPQSSELVIGKDVLDVAPEVLHSTLNTADKREEVLDVTLSNQSGVQFEIKRLSFTGDFKGLLNAGAMDAYLSSWVGTKLNAGSEQQMTLLKTILALNAEDYMAGPESIDAKLEIVLWNPAFLAEYAFDVPVKVEVSIGGSVDTEACVHIDGVDVPSWDVTILNNRAVTEFEIYNACTKGGAKIDVDNLQAKLEWNEDSKKAGIIELTIFNPDGQAVSEVLRPGEWITFWPNMVRNTFGSYSAVLTFTPKPGYLNETASFSVFIDAETNTDEGKVKVNSETVSIDAGILVLNLDDCIQMPQPGEKVTMAADQDEVTFEIDAGACNADVEISLCMGDPRCKGGTAEGGIRLTPREFRLRQGSPSQAVTIYREDVPGIYGIPVFARLGSTSFQRVRRIDLLIEPRSGQWFSLNRYEAMVSGDVGWKDRLRLQNNAPIEDVEIIAKYCSKCKKRDGEWLAEDCIWNKVLEEDAQKEQKNYLNWIWDAIKWATTCSSLYNSLVDVDKIVENAVEEAIANANDNWSEAVEIVAGPGVLDEVVDILQPAGQSLDAAYFVGETETLPPGFGMERGFIGGDITIGSQEEEKAEFIWNWILAGVCAAGSLFINYGNYAWWGDQCDWDYMQKPLPDYIIDFNSDTARELDLEKDLFTATFNVEEINKFATEFTESVPIDLENTSHTESVERMYEVMTVKATEHIHGDPTHQNPLLRIEDTNFGSYNIPDSHIRTYGQRFHIAIDSKAAIDFELPPLEDFYSCVDGTKIGITGTDARPKVKFDWSWGSSGIGMNDCDSENSQGIYCDAAQLSIALSKRIHRIEEFLAANNHDLGCPIDPRAQSVGRLIDNINSNYSTNEIADNELGLSRIDIMLNANEKKLTVTATAKNKKGESHGATVEIIVNGPDGYFEECSEEIASISSGGTKTATCVFTGLETHGTQPYYATAYITASSAGSWDTTQVRKALLFTEGEGACWAPRSNMQINGRAAIEYFINSSIPGWGDYVQASSLSWPSDWPGMDDEEKIEYLKSLFQFKANLIKDGYSIDFQKDFANYYSGTTFFDVPSWFYSGSNNQLADYFKSPERLKFKQKFGSETTLPGPGVYEVYVNIDFGENDWSLYKEGQPKGKIEIEFYKVSDPRVGSIFYYLPFDGQVGKDSVNGRQSYGLNYLNNTGEIQVSGGSYAVYTTHMATSNTISTMTTLKKGELKYLNSSAATRGGLLSIEMQGNDPVMVFSPSYATPIIMKVEKETSDAAFSSEYTFLENEQPVHTGNSLTFWTGLGECADFTGQPIREVFYYAADQRGTEKAYKVRWDVVPYGGVVYLYSTFYTPVENSYYIKAETGETAFISPDESEANSVAVNGIIGMENNSKGSGSQISNVERILELVESGHVCVTNSGTKSSFWWNPKKLKDTKGQSISVTEFEQTLQPGSTCIGPETE